MLFYTLYRLSLPINKFEGNIVKCNKTFFSGSSTNSLHDRLAAFERCSETSEKDHMKKIISEREKEMEMLRHRWDRYKGSTENEINFEVSVKFKISLILIRIHAIFSYSHITAQC